MAEPGVAALSRPDTAAPGKARRDDLLRNVARKTIERAAGRLAHLARGLYRSPQERRVEPWFRDRGDTTLRLEYDLDATSFVVDLGGFEGQWTSDLFARYCCQVWVFEAAPEFASAIERRFARNPEIQVFPFGLGDRNTELILSLRGDSSSIFDTDGPTTRARIACASEFLAESGIERIDLMKINIEGAEYDLLDHLMATGWIRKIRNVQVQFHDFVPHAEERMRAIQRRLAETHAPTWQYEFVWENWKRTEGP